MTAKDRKRQLARQRYERQQQAQRARRVRKKWGIGIVSGLVVLALGGSGLAFAFAGEGGKKSGAAAAPSSSAPATPTPSPTPTVKAGECAYTASQEPGAKDVGMPPVKPRYTSTVTATVKTNLGSIAMSLNGARARCTVNSFAYLAGKNFFDKTQCHRLVTEGIKVLQCGDPTATGSGGPAYKYGEENLPKPKAGAQTATYTKGTLAMANAGPGTNGSQFFIVYGDSELPPNYTVFGKITSGMDIVESVAKAGVKGDAQGDGAPQKAVTIQDVTITKK
ncbi:MAG TPA: peptidylprolyl isomerase [Streptosporangiaceae bacterium]|nr:peptidylprolyl isomerase [Streptosporangiaceae bacterium]